MKHYLNHSIGWLCVIIYVKSRIKTPSNATDMRHYVATAYALLDISVANREMFYKHLGHSQNMNENVYNSPSAIRTITFE